MNNIMNNKKVLLVGGGTGGHVVPVYGLYNRLKDLGIETTVLGGGSDIEREFFRGNPDYHILHTGKIHRQLTLRNLWEIMISLYGFVSSFFILLFWRPKLIFAKGGYVSLPIVIWARILKVPYFVHESDIEMGLSNRIAATGAEKVFVGFPAKYYPHVLTDKLVFSGQIISEDFDKKIGVDFGFKKDHPVILITGGSLGALSINRSVMKSLIPLIKRYNVIHQTGSQGYREVANFRMHLTPEEKAAYYICDFLTDRPERNMMVEAIRAADLVIARAGATTIAEIAYLEKPMLLVPYKYASAHHQSKNAKALVEAEAAETISDDKFTHLDLVEKIDEILRDEEYLEQMAKNAKSFFPTDALEKISDEIIERIKE